jgi:hypothetical protein
MLAGGMTSGALELEAERTLLVGSVSDWGCKGVNDAVDGAGRERDGVMLGLFEALGVMEGLANTDSEAVGDAVAVVELVPEAESDCVVVSRPVTVDDEDALGVGVRVPDAVCDGVSAADALGVSG